MPSPFKKFGNKGKDLLRRSGSLRRSKRRGSLDSDANSIASSTVTGSVPATPTRHSMYVSSSVPATPASAQNGHAKGGAEKETRKEYEEMSMWDQAYENLRTKEDPDLIAKYEAVLARELEGPPAVPGTLLKPLDESSGGIPEDPKVRKEKVMVVLEKANERGLQRLEEKELKYTIAGHTFNFTEQIATTSRVIQWGKILVDEAVKVSPEASLAWCGASLVLPLLTRSSEATADHREAFSYVTARMQYYEKLEPLLFHSKEENEGAVPKENVVDLYQQILSFQFNSVLRFFRGRFKNWARDVAQTEDWAGMAQGIKDAEGRLDNDVAAISHANNGKQLVELNKRTKDLADRLLSIAKEHLEVSKKHLVVAEDQRDMLEEILEMQKDQKIKLPTVESAIFTSDAVSRKPKCHPNTRKLILQQLNDWADDSSDRILIWLTGHAGTGKSTISRTIAREFQVVGRLAASYFFKRDDELRSGSSSLFPTIAAQLMVTIPGFKDCLFATMKKINVDGIAEMSLEEQFRNLISVPLSQIQRAESSIPQLIVIDALDECSKENDVSRILRVIGQLGEDHESSLRFMITSRPTDTIESTFGKPEKRKIPHRRLSLLESEYLTESKKDVEMYLIDTLAALAEDKDLEDWPKEGQMNRIVELSTSPKPLFVYASTLCRHVGATKGDPVSRLDNWLEKANSNETELDAKLDQMYQVVLDAVWSSAKDLKEGDSNDEDDDDFSPSLSDDEKSDLTQMLKSIVLLGTPLPPKRLAHLIGIPQHRAALLRNLRSVLDVPTDDQSPVEIIHKSFSDFLLRQQASSSGVFQMDVIEAHLELLNCCLRRMLSEEDGLRKDICDIHDFAKGRKEIDPAVIAAALPPEMEYACINWMYHLLSAQELLPSPPKPVDAPLPSIFFPWDYIFATLLWFWLLLPGTGRSSANAHITPVTSKASNIWVDVQALLEIHYLHWLETLSILGRLSGGVLTIAALKRTATKMSPDSDLAAWAEDAHRFLMTNRSAIETAPLQLYSSAIVFSPERSLIRQCYEDEETKWISRKPDAGIEWSNCIQTLYGFPQRIEFVVFSHSSRLVAVAGRDGAVWIWDVVSGSYREPLSDLGKLITGIGFSSDDTRLTVVLRDRTIIVADLLDASWEVVMKSTGASILVPCAVSDDGTKVAFGSPDGDVTVHEIRQQTVSRLENGNTSGATVAHFTLEGDGHGSEVVAFSKDGRHILSSAWNKTVKVWDIASRRGQSTKIDGERGLGAFFAKDQRVFMTLKLDVAEVSSVLKTVDESPSKPFDCIAISNDDATIPQERSSKSRQDITQLIDVASGTCLELQQRQLTNLNHLAFARDGNSLISVSNNKIVKQWSISRAGAVTERSQSHERAICYVALSPDGKTFASGSTDGIIKVWDLQNGSCIQTLSQSVPEDDDNRIRVLVFSQDGNYLVTFANSIFNVWNVKTGKSIGTIANKEAYYMSAIAISPDGTQFATSGRDYLTIIYVWRLGEEKPLKRKQFEGPCGAAIAFSSDGKKLVSSDRSVMLWDLKDDTVKTLHQPQDFQRVWSIAFTPDGKQIVGGDTAGKIATWDTDSGHVNLAFTTNVKVRNLAFEGTSMNLATDVGMFAIPHGPSMTNPASVTLNKPSGYGVTSDLSWITWNGRKVIWIPHEYRYKAPLDDDDTIASTSYKGHAVGPGAIVLGTTSGKIFSFVFSQDEMPYPAAV